MLRTQISLDDVQMAELRAMAHRSGTSIAALIRQAVDDLLRSGPAADRAKAVAVLGKYRSGGPGDISEQHDRELDEIFDR